MRLGELARASVAAWMLREQARNALDLRRQPGCDGCELWGLCAMHETDTGPVRAARAPRACACGVPLPSRYPARSCAACRTVPLPFAVEASQASLFPGHEPPAKRRA